jgi:hypothetical protein
MRVFFLRDGCVPVPRAGIVGWRMGIALHPGKTTQVFEIRI